MIDVMDELDMDRKKVAPLHPPLSTTRCIMYVGGIHKPFIVLVVKGCTESRHISPSSTLATLHPPSQKPFVKSEVSEISGSDVRKRVRKYFLFRKEWFGMLTNPCQVPRIRKSLSVRGRGLLS